MIQKIKLHIQKNIFYDIFVAIIVVLFNIILFKFINDYSENKRLEYDFTSYETSIKQAYFDGKLKINFDKNNIGILKMDDLIESTNCVDSVCTEPIITQMNIRFSKELDQCVGYIILEKLNNDLKVDTSHICDMIDY